MGFYSTLQYINSLPVERETMASAKTATLTFRIEPSLKEALRTAAAREHRSIANMVEVLIRDYCGRNDIEVTEQDAPTDTSKAAGVRRTRNR